MMKALYVAVGLAGFLMAGSANATVVYDTITGQTENCCVRDALATGAVANRGPLGDAYTPASTEDLTSVTLRLRNKATSTDTGAVMLFLDTSTGTGASNVPSATGVTLPSTATLLGIIDDSQVPADGATIPDPSAFVNVTVPTSVILAAGTTYWFELVDAADPNNGDGNTVSSMLKWGINSDVNGLGVPGNPNDIFSVANGSDLGLAAFNSTDDPNVTNSNTGAKNGEVFEMQLNVPEPASLALFGAGLIGLGISRRRQAKKQAA